jgi:hypothetical protein
MEIVKLVNKRVHETLAEMIFFGHADFRLILTLTRHEYEGFLVVCHDASCYSRIGLN